MPYVNEGRSLPHEVDFAWADYLPNGVRTPWPETVVASGSEAQYGWRSEGEREASREALAAVQKNANWADTSSVIAAMDRVERSMTNPLIRDPSSLPVNDRDYTRISTGGSPAISLMSDAGTPTYRVKSLCRGSIASTPDLPSENQIRAVGGQLMRASRPTMPAANLNQWFGELRQFGSGFQVPRTMPTELANKPGLRGEIARFRQGGRAVGSAYLAGQFGWIPFFGEIISSLEAVADSEKIIDQYLRDSGKLVPRMRTRTLFQDAHSFKHYTSSSNTAGQWGYSNFHNVLGVYGGVAIQKGWGNSRFDFNINTTITRKRVQRSGALWEYFAADPDGALGRLRSYAQKAKAILGDPLLSYSTLWELAPWSWLVDWRFDFGGLLSFQESVATDSLAARRSWTVVEDEVSLHSIIHPNYRTGSGTRVCTVERPGNAFATYKKQIRRSGSPYDMGIDWSGFTTQQWFILGALGLTKAPGIPK